MTVKALADLELLLQLFYLSPSVTFQVYTLATF